jgi:hypothetical protein
MVKRKRTKNDTQNITQKTKNLATRTPLQAGDEEMIMTTINGTYPLSFVTDIFCNQVMVTTIQLLKRWLQLNITNKKPLSRNSLWDPQALEYRINWETYTPYAGAAGMLIHINGKVTMGNLRESLLSKIFVPNRSSLSVLKCKSRYEAEIAWLVRL